MALSAFIGSLLISTEALLTTEEVNNSIEQAKGVFMLKDDTYDDFINWNNYTFICFHNKK